MPDELKLETEGIKKKVHRIIFTVRVDEDVLALLSDYQQKNHLNKSNAIRMLIAKGLKENGL